MEENNYNYENEGNKINKTKIISNAITLTIAIVLSAIILFCLYIVAKPYFATTLTSNFFTQEQIDRLETAAKIIDNDFLYEYDKEKLVDGAIDGMVNSLDNIYTYYEFEDEYQESSNGGSNDNYVGIGVHLIYDTTTKAIKILGTMPNSPAEQAGVKAGDVILTVDELYVTTDTYLEAVDKIKGEPDTTVKLTILRNGETFELEVKRASIVENNVASEVIDDIGYIRIFSFDNGIYNQFKEEYTKLREKNVKGIIVDLRNNSGGYVADTLNILNLLLPKLDVLKLVDKDGNARVFRTDDTEQIDIPLAVIVNQNSASSSEIFASAIKDSKKGIVIGTKTFGKGVVQYVEPIANHGAISIVAAQYFTPSGVVIQDNGIEPNIVVELPDEIKNNSYIERDQDLQLQEAIKYINSQM